MKMGCPDKGSPDFFSAGEDFFGTYKKWEANDSQAI
jgi:hypothetical protein